MTEDRGRKNDYTGQYSDELGDDSRGYTVGAIDYNRTDENKSSDEIKADIEQTRNEMSQKINKIQERLDPNRLKEQAQETVRSAVSDSTDALVSFVRDSAGDIGYTIVDTIKHNPVPAALVGIGLGWMIFKGFSSSSSDWQSNDDNYRQRYNGGRNAGYGYPQSSRQDGDQSRYAYAAGGERGGQYQGSQYQSGRYPSDGPYASSAPYPSSAQNRGYTSQTAYTSGYVESDGVDYDQQEQSRVGQAVQSVQNKASDALDQARDTAGQLTGQAQETAQQAKQYVQDKAGQVRDQAAQLGEQAQQTLQDTGRQAQRTVESNPVPFGVAALVAGVLIGLALPETQTENQILGEKRDQLIDNAQSVAQDVKQRVQNIVEEKMPEVKQTAQKVAEDLKQTGKSAADDIKQTLKEAGESAKQEVNDVAQTGKDAAKDIAQNATQSINNKATTTDTWSTIRTSSGMDANTVPEEGSAKNVRM